MGDADAVKAVFRKLDTEGTGAIDRKELTAAIHQLDPSFSEAELLKSFKDADLNNDGLIDYDEFVSWLFQETDSPNGGTRKKVQNTIDSMMDKDDEEEEDEDEEEDGDDEEEDDEDEQDEEDEDDEDDAD